MKIAVVVYDKLNLLSLAQILHFLNSFEVKHEIKICAFKSEIADEYGLKITPEIYGESLYGYDAIVVPDGIGALSLRYDEIFLSWIRSASRTRVKIAFDLGSLVLGGAGFLEGKSACVRGGYKNALKEYAKFTDSQICEDGDVITICELNDMARDRIAEILG